MTRPHFEFEKVTLFNVKWSWCSFLGRFLFFDGGRSSHHGHFCNAFKAIGGLKWRTMNLIYSESSRLTAFSIFYFAVLSLVLVSRCQ